MTNSALKPTREFAKQQQTIDDIADARWYVQDRSSVGGYSSLDSDVSSIETLGYAFPVVFLLVAVLMSLTSMTRMVEEERGLIGTYTGLGYGSLTIASRYLVSPRSPCLIGGGIGLLVGFLGIPAFLLDGAGEHVRHPRNRPRIRLAVRQPGHRAVRRRRADGHGRGVPGRTAADAGPAHAVRRRQRPARAYCSNASKPVWRRLSFLNKVTVRNIFRFKSRLIMTVGGVAGCTALIVCGFAINDSVDTLGPKQ